MVEKNTKSNYFAITFYKLTLVKGVYSFRYFLYQMRIPNLVMQIFIFGILNMH